MSYRDSSETAITSSVTLTSGRENGQTGTYFTFLIIV